MVLGEWQRTNSPLYNYWMLKFVSDRANFLKNYVPPRAQFRSGIKAFRYGLPHFDVIQSVCKSKYENEVVKLNVQIADPSVMVVEKGVSSTFADQLGVVGKHVTL